MNNGYSQEIGTQIVRDDWTRADSKLAPDTNRIRFGEYVEESSIPYFFQKSLTNGGNTDETIAGYSHTVDQSNKTVTLFTPPLSAPGRIYGRIGGRTTGEDTDRFTNWFRIIVRDTTQGDGTWTCFVRDVSTGITLSGEAYNADEEELGQAFNGIQLPRAIAQIYIETFHGTINVNPGANVYV